MLTYGPVKIERWRPEEANASAYALDDRIILTGESLTTVGGLNCGPYIRLEPSTSDSELGALVLRVLAEAKIMPVPSDLKTEMQKLLQIAGVRSWSKLTSGAYCSMTQKLGEIAMLPGFKDGRAILHLPELQLRIPDNSIPDEVGRALREVFKRSREETA